MIVEASSLQHITDMVELRKRKATTDSALPPPVKKANSIKASSGSNKAKSSDPANMAAKSAATGDIVDLEGFGGQIETQDGEKITLKKLVEDSKNGVVLFTYPKASTPGCRDSQFSVPSACHDFRFLL